jgi:hypothetical protein
MIPPAQIGVKEINAISGMPLPTKVDPTKVAIVVLSLGYEVKVCKRRHGHRDPTIALSFHMRRVAYDGPDDATGTIDQMIQCLNEEYSAVYPELFEGLPHTWRVQYHRPCGA